MPKNDRINYEGLNKEYILSRIEEIVGSDKTEMPKDLENYSLPIQCKVYSSEEVQAEIEKVAGPLMKLVTRFAFRYKNVIKKIPIVSDYAIQIKESYIHRDGNEKDVAYLLQLDINTFITQCYLILLERQPDSEGFVSYQKLICEGMPKEAVVYLFVISEEFNSRFQISNIFYYAKSYKHYKLKMKIKNFPVCGYIVKFLLFPREMYRLAVDMRVNEANKRQQLEGIISIVQNNQVCIANLEQNLSVLKNDLLIQEDNIIKQEKLCMEYVQQHYMQLKNMFQVQGEFNISLSNYLIQQDEISKNLLIQQDKISEILNDLLNRHLNMQNRVEKITNEFFEMQDKIVAKFNEHILEGKIYADDLKNHLQEGLGTVTDLITLYGIKGKSVISGFPGGVTVVQTNEFLFGVPSEEWRLAMYLSTTGAFEIGMEKAFKRILAQGQTVLDIGANLGIYTLHAAKAGCRVYSYEPTPATYNILNENIRVNGFAESGLITTFNLAVGETERKANFTIIEGICGWNNMFSDETAGRKIEVSVVCLDHHLSEGIKVDIMKIDVEGGEKLVFDGMKQLIDNNPEIKIFMEFAPDHLIRANVDPVSFLHELRLNGFIIKVVDDFSGDFLDKTDEELQSIVSSNLFLYKGKKL